MQLLVKKRTKTHTQKKSQNKENQPTNQPTLKCQLIQKSAKNRKEPETPMVELQLMKLNHCISLYPFLK